jgi:hypothetical protein
MVKSGKIQIVQRFGIVPKHNKTDDYCGLVENPKATKRVNKIH